MNNKSITFTTTLRSKEITENEASGILDKFLLMPRTFNMGLFLLYLEENGVTRKHPMFSCSVKFKYKGDTIKVTESPIFYRPWYIELVRWLSIKGFDFSNIDRWMGKSNK